MLGDANLDGVVDGQDMIAWGRHKFTFNSNWCDGDFTADGMIDGQDFIEWTNHKFMIADLASQHPTMFGVAEQQLLTAIDVAEIFADVEDREIHSARENATVHVDQRAQIRLASQIAMRSTHPGRDTNRESQQDAIERMIDELWAL